MRTDWTIFSFESLGSTQDVAKSYLPREKEAKPLPFAVRADVQTAGRGRLGNQWVSLTGNLFTSLCVDVGSVPAQRAGQYSFLAAVALMNTLAEYGVTGAQNKWPNDILVSGQKIAGILLESDIDAQGQINALIIGVGVNLAAAPDGAISVRDITGASISPSDFLEKFIDKLQNQLDGIALNGFAAIRESWLSKAYGLGQKIRVRLPAETFYGEFLGLDDGGALLVRPEGETETRIIHSGEVFFGS